MSGEEKDDRPDSSKHAVHLRTVHFSLLIACAVLLATAFARVKSDAELARDQLLQIREALGAWNYHWLEEEVDKQLTWEHFFPSQHLAPQVLGDTGICTKTRTPSWTMHPTPDFLRDFEPDSRKDNFKAYFPFSGDKRPLVLDPPKTIGQVQSLWDGLAEPVPVYFPTSAKEEAYVYLTDGYELGGEVTFLPMTELDAEEADDCADVRFRMLDPNEVERIASALADPKDQLTYGYVGGSGPPRGDVYRIIIPALTKSTSVDGRRGLTRMLDVDWGSRRFSHLFRELHQLTESLGLKDLNFDQAEAVLELERQRDGDRYEFFGISVPATTVVQWGLLALIVLQVYQYLHLEHFRQRVAPNDKAFDVPWIGVYPSRRARIITLLSTSVFPPVVAVCLGWLAYQDLLRWWSVLIVAIGVLISVGVAVFTARVFFAISPYIHHHGDGIANHPDSNS